MKILGVQDDIKLSIITLDDIAFAQTVGDNLCHGRNSLVGPLEPQTRCGGHGLLTIEAEPLSRDPNNRQAGSISCGETL
jgi:hypothetical protein